MTELKLRAWDEQNKIMHYDFEGIRSGIEGNDWIIFKSDKQPLSGKPHPFENPYFSQQLKIMIFSTLTDKDNSPIWESDIIQRPNGRGVVQFCNGIFGINWDYPNPPDWIEGSLYGAWGQSHNLRRIDDGFNRYIKVIGNIYENPELLKKEEE